MHWPIEDRDILATCTTHPGLLFDFGRITHSVQSPSEPFPQCPLYQANSMAMNPGCLIWAGTTKPGSVKAQQRAWRIKFPALAPKARRDQNGDIPFGRICWPSSPSVSLLVPCDLCPSQRWLNHLQDSATYHGRNLRRQLHV